MTFNAEFLWDGVDPEEGTADFPWKDSQTEAEDHMRQVAEVIKRSNPDVVNLVEVENLQALTTFNDRFLAGRGYRPYFVQGKDTSTGQDVVLLTRVDPEGSAIARDDRKGRAGNVLKSVSKNYFAKLTADNTKIAVIGLHFLARPDDEGRRLEREAQADAIRNLGKELHSQGFWVIVLGDFNDYDGDAGSRDHQDSTPITNVLRIVRGLDPAEPADDLTNAASLVPKAQRFTAFWDKNSNGRTDPPGEFTSIDHILLSPELAAKIESVEIDHSHDPTKVSDHFPVVVRLKLCDTGPIVPGEGRVRMTSLLPNPPGNDTQHEEVTLKNVGTQDVTMTGWKLRDLAGRTWSLDPLGTLQAGEEKTIKRNGQPMALDNRGDTIDLLDGAGNVVHSVTYFRVEEGEVVTPAE
jgi:exonuclease III